MNTRNGMVAGVVALGIAALVGCSSNQTRDARVEGVSTTIEAHNAHQSDELVNTISAEMESWDERLSDLRARAVTTNARDRFTTINDNIGKMEDRMADARKHFLDMRLAKSDGERFDKKQKLNEDFAKLRQIYNTVPAE